MEQTDLSVPEFLSMSNVYLANITAYTITRTELITFLYVCTQKANVFI